jgi:Serine dehydrogenase proteinase
MRFRNIVRKKASRKNAGLFLTTFGGDADAAYRIARFLQQSYTSGNLTLYIYSQCKSAGTLLAVAANELVMSDEGELGPLDVQLSKPDELAEYSSGLTPTQALSILRAESYKVFEGALLETRFRSGRQITTKMAAELASQIAIGLFRPIYEQLDPMRLAETERATMIAWEYGCRLTRGNITEECIDTLITGYPAHGFVIDRVEAGVLFKSVRVPDELESKLFALIRKIPHEQKPLMGFLGPKTKTNIATKEQQDEPAGNDNRTAQESEGKGKNSGPPDSQHGQESADSARMPKSVVAIQDDGAGTAGGQRPAGDIARR